MKKLPPSIRKAERQKKKVVRQVAANANLVERVRALELPQERAKIPLSPNNPCSIMDERFSFDVTSACDREGHWSWGESRNWCQFHKPNDKSCASEMNACDCGEIVNTLREFTKLTWSEILSQVTGHGRARKRRKKHHSQSFDDIVSEAQNRWIEIERDEDELFRFRYGGEKRLWGFRKLGTFYAVWWEEHHNIDATAKKN
nr:hypothetical protein [uncultured Cohaesibacter sp.]